LLLQQLTQLQQQLGSRGFDVRRLVFEPPATEEQVVLLERALGLRLPPSFRRVLLNISSHVEFRWFMPDELKLPDPFGSNFSGDLHWSLDFTLQFEKNRMGWIENVFPNRDDPYDAVWWDKLAFYEIGNGDLLAIDLAKATYERIVYLSHDDGQGHGYALAENFEDLLARWVPLACAGGEDWQWLPFATNRASLLDPACENASRWRSLIGISL
jgi:hypothetical protein